MVVTTAFSRNRREYQIPAADREGFSIPGVSHVVRLGVLLPFNRRLRQYRGTSMGQHIGRVGALALALGVGGVIAGLPAIASADTGNSGKTTSSADSSAKAGPKARKTGAGSGKKLHAAAVVDAPVITVSTAHSLRAAHRVTLDSVGGGGDPVAPVASPLELAALALRRELASVKATVVPAAVVTTGEPAVPAAVTDMTFWNNQVAPALTNFIKTGINYAGLSSQYQAAVNAVLPTVVEILGDAYYGNPVNSALTGLANNQAFLGLVANQTQATFTAVGLTAPAAHVVGQAVGYLAQTLLSNTTAQNAIGTLVHTLTVVPNGWTLTQFVQNLNSPDFYLDDLVKLDFLQSSLAFVKAVPVLLADQGLRPVVFDAIKGAAHVLVGLSGWQEAPSSAFVHFIGDQVELGVGGGPISNGVAVVVTLAGRAAVEHILSSAVIVDGALGAVETTVSTFLDYAGVGAALTTAANSLGPVLAIEGADHQAAFDATMQALTANANVRVAIGQALKVGVKSAAANAAMLNEIGATIKTFITDVATAPALQTGILNQIGPLSGGEFVGVLNNAPAMDKIAGAIAGMLPKFLGARGVGDALGEAVNQIALAAFANGETNDIVENALAALQANPAIKAALKSTVAAAVRGVLSVRALEQAAARIVGYGFQDLFASSTLSPALKLLAANALKSVVHSLLGDGSVRNLIGSLAGDIAAGKPAGDVVKSFVATVLASPGVQLAVGTAVGQAVGSAFGGGPIGFLVAQFVGVPTGIFIAMNAPLALLVVRFGLLDGLFAQLTNSLPQAAA
jgi:hypothetical protein